MTNEAKGMGKGLLIGIISGAAFGSALALLYAPKTGKRLREDIKNKSQDFIDDTDEYISNAKEKAYNLFRDVKKKSETLVGEAEENAKAIIDESDKILTHSKDKVGSFVQNGKIKLEKENERMKSAIKAGMEAYKIEKKT